jgi:hypothetical protein
MTTTIYNWKEVEELKESIENGWCKVLVFDFGDIEVAIDQAANTDMSWYNLHTELTEKDNVGILKELDWKYWEEPDHLIKAISTYLQNKEMKENIARMDAKFPQGW